MKFLLASIFCLSTFLCQAQYSFELKVDYSSRIGNTDNFSVSGDLIKGKIENGKKYYTTEGAELKVINLMSAKTTTSVDEAIAPQKVSIGLECKNFVPQQNVMLLGIATQPSFGGAMVKTYDDEMPEGMMQVKVNGMMFKGKQISKPIKTKQGDVLDMFYKAGGNRVFWLQIGNLSKIENLPMRLPADSSLIGTDQPYCKIAFMPDGFLPTDLPNNYKAYEDKTGDASILITQLKKYTFQATIEFGGALKPNSKLLEENPDAGILNLTNGRVDKIMYEEH